MTIICQPDSRLETVCFAIVSKELGILKSTYRYAIRWGWVNNNPLTGLSLNQEGEGRLRWLTREEESRLLLACAPWLQDIVTVGLDTGLRRANLVELRRDWEYHDGTVLIIPRQHIKLKKSEVTIDHSRRTHYPCASRGIDQFVHLYPHQWEVL